MLGTQWVDDLVQILDAIGRIITPAGVLVGMILTSRGLSQSRRNSDKLNAAAPVLENIEKKAIEIDDSVNKKSPGGRTIAEEIREAGDRDRAQDAAAESGLDPYQKQRPKE